MDLPINFENCPVCGGEDTVTRIACANDPSIAPGTFVSLEKSITPIHDINRISTPTVKAILCHYDICAGCGTKYCTRAEIVSAPIPVKVQYQSGGRKGFG